jgi:hypothetical protein
MAGEDVPAVERLKFQWQMRFLQAEIGMLNREIDDLNALAQEAIAAASRP